jgi:hypothetical protein
MQGRQFEPLPEGVYTVKIWDVKQKMSEPKPDKPSSPYLEFVFRPEGYNRNLWDRFSLKETAIWRLQQFFAVLGKPHTGPIDMDLDELIGMQVDVVVEHSEYKGKMGEKITDYRESQFGGELSDVDEVPF